MQPTLFDIRNANWEEWRYSQIRREELAEVEKKRSEHNKRSWSSKEAWQKRKQK